jgi:hypothetical protein
MINQGNLTNKLLENFNIDQNDSFFYYLCLFISILMIFIIILIIVQYSWNMSISRIFDVREITMMETFWLYILASILFTRTVFLNPTNTTNSNFM